MTHLEKETICKIISDFILFFSIIITLQHGNSGFPAVFFKIALLKLIELNVEVDVNVDYIRVWKQFKHLARVTLVNSKSSCNSISHNNH